MISSMATVLLKSPRMSARSVALRLALLVSVAVVPAACGDDTPTSPTTDTSTTTTTVAEASVTESFSGVLPVASARFYSFEVSANGTVTVSLDNVGGVTGVPSTIWVGLGLGTPEATDCSTTTSLNTQAGGGPHISTTLTPGTYCARIYDIGNLAGSAPFTVTIAHP